MSQNSPNQKKAIQQGEQPHLSLAVYGCW